ncbi:MAG TPA: hypothetical protein VGC85_00700, partial [Chthoniobacterales bacterium]
QEQRYHTGRTAVCCAMITSSPKVAPTLTPAAAYRRAHAGKLMIIEPKVNRPPVPSDFFHVDSVGSHPSGLLVTGIFAEGRIASMMASSVREANEAEIASLRSGT